ncbi:hypothetical protein F5I97DRAFT_1972805 [Phlebopus sp. FC_14]|nr:hypothetical protein F5I97DRAFT_1972805 [Phlebopus sp. FC_14]
MREGDDHILREKHPEVSLIPVLDPSLLRLSEKQRAFLLHAIRGLDDEQIRTRILEVQRDTTYPYPCFRAFHHVSLYMSENDAYDRILELAQEADQSGGECLFLDIGCCMGTDLRHLVLSGFPAGSVIGCDVREEFIELGYKLYGDRDICKIPFFVGDVFDIVLAPGFAVSDVANVPLTSVSSLDQLRGRVKYIYSGALFHLFDEGTQEAIARRLSTLLNIQEGSGKAVVFGRHSAKAEEGMIDDTMKRVRYAHSPASWERMWKRVLGDKIPVSVEAVLRRYYDDAPPIHPQSTGMMYWSVWIG